jgi:hypothetical protein
MSDFVTLCGGMELESGGWIPEMGNKMFRSAAGKDNK